MTAPLTPPGCDLRGLPYFPLDVGRLKDSDLFALSTGDEFKAALALWCRAWVEVPAGSLPDDERLLCRFAGLSLTEWKAVADMALRGFVRCDDGRLYHATVAEKACRAWLERVGLRERSAKAQAKRHPGFTYQPEAFEEMRQEGLACLERLAPGSALALGLVLRGAPTAPTGSVNGSLSSPTGRPKASEVEGEGEVEGEVEDEGEGSVASPDGDARTDLDHALEAWRETASRCGLAQLRGLSEPRRKKLRAILKAHGLDGWREALAEVEASSFLRGLKPGRDGRVWKASFDFLIAPASFLKVIEGVYADGSPAPSSGDYMDLAFGVVDGGITH